MESRKVQYNGKVESTKQKNKDKRKEKSTVERRKVQRKGGKYK
jgi:hypothetical protein